MSRTASWSGTVLAALAITLAAAPAGRAASSPVRVSAKPISKALTTKDAKTTITIRNAGKKRLSGLSLSVAPKKGVRATLAGARKGKRTRALKTLRPGKSARVSVRLRRTGKSGPTSGSLTVRVRRKGKTIGSGRLAFGPSGSTSAPEPNSLAGRYFWGSQYTLNGIQQHTLYFTGPNLVYTSDLEGAFPVCAAVTEQCRPYSYDAKTKALTIDGKQAKLEGDKLTVDDDDPADGEIDGQTHFELGVPTPGARWDVVLTYSNSSGLCPLYCNYYTEHLTFRPDGTFIRSSVASGSGPVVDYAVVPDDSKGTYEVRADRKLRLAFADGKERIETLGIFPANDGSYPANPTSGVVLDGDGYFDIRD